MCAYYTKIHAKTLSPVPEKHSSEFFKKAMDASSRVTLFCRREPKQAINEFTRKETKMLKIEFKVGNAAFREEDEDGNDRLRADAVADTVEELAGKIREGFTSGPVMDANGNTVGSWSLND